MAALIQQQFAKQWQDGQAERTAVYALRNVSTGDTADLTEDFSVLKRAIIMGTTVAGTAVASVSGTTVTLPAGLSADAGFLMAFGCAR